MLLLLLSCLLISFTMMVVAWLLYLVIKNPGVIDGFWPLTITLNACLFGLWHQHFTLSILLTYVCLWLWCLRLAGYLWFKRIIPNHVDKRYVDLSEGWQMKKSMGFLWNFLLQGLLAWVIAMPFLFIKAAPHFNVLFYIAIVLILASIFLETLADKQLQKFKQQQLGQVCNVGLWHYSRHPNLFFEWLIWFGFALVAIAMSPLGWLGLISPLLLLFIMLVLTIPLTEQGSLKSRGDAFKQYQQTTACFFPWFKKNHL